MRKGFTLVEVVVAVGLVLLVGASLTSLIVRSERGARSSEAGEAAALFARTLILQAREAPPAWLPKQEGESVNLSADQIQEVLNNVPSITYTDPSLYEVRVTRVASSQPGASQYEAQVCLKPGGEPVCVVSGFFLAASSAYVPPPDLAPTPPPSGRAVILLSISGPDGGLADVSAGSATYTRYGLYTQEVSPGTVTVTARDTADGRYTYQASPRTQTATLSAGQSKSFSIAYTCVTGAADFSVVPPPGVEALPSGTITLNPSGTDVSKGGLVPYLAPGNYTVNAKSVRSGSYTYDATVYPSKTFTVSACATSDLTVAYQAVTGALRVEIDTPPGMTLSPSVQVFGPDPSLPKTLSATTTLENLVPGGYTVSPRDILDAGVRFRGQASPANPTVQAGQTTVSKVVYAPVSARLVVELREEKPGQPAPRLAVQGPGLNRSLTAYGTHTFDDLSPGDYSLKASVVQDSLYTYAPEPLNRAVSLAAGDRKTETVVYRATTGALEVRVSGLPKGAAPAVKLDGAPLAFSGNTVVVPYLAPGAHSLTAENVSYGGYVYEPSPKSTSLSISAGQKSTATVSYTRLEGTVVVEVTGLPTGVAPSVVLTLPDGSTRSIATSGTTTFAGMPTGTYTVSAQDVNNGGVLYKAKISPTSAKLDPGGSVRFSVTYEAQNGLLQVNVSGLPSGVDAKVTVTGPGGYAQALKASQTLPVPSGTYTVSAQDVSADLSTPYGRLVYVYKPAPATQNVSVKAGATSVANVTYTKQSGTLVLTVDNPTGKSASVRVVGPGGFNRSLTAPAGKTSHTFSDVPVGAYTVTGTDVSANGYTYKAAPAEGNLQAGQTLSLSLVYQAATGAVRVTVAAPSGMPAPTVRLLDAGKREVGRFTGTSYTFTNLVPGSYTVSPDPVTDTAGFAYRASAAPVKVEAGKTASVSVAYVKQSGTVTVSISGLPSGAKAQVTVSGPKTATFAASGSVELPLGNYTVSVGKVSYGGYEYLGSASPSSFSLSNPGEAKNVAVSYVEASGTVSLTVSGLPSGASVTLYLGSYSKTCGNGTCNFTRLPLGSYTLTAPDYRDALYDYKPTASPTSYTLSNPGAVLTGTVTYQAATGAVKVTVAAPSGMPAPTVRLLDAGKREVGRFTGTSYTFTNLVPGSYTVSPDPVTDTAGFAYRASAAPVKVEAGKTASVSVAYVKQSGTVTVSISGLPSGAKAQVTVSGPKTATFAASGSVELPLGNYTVSVGKVSYGGYEYLGSASPSSFSLSNPGEAKNVAVSYVEASGTVSLTVSGLPSGASVTLYLGSYSKTCGNGTCNFTRLPLGSYTLTAPDYRDALYDYKPTASPTSYTLSNPGAVLTGTVTYQATTGAVKVTISGPSGMPSPTVRLKNASGSVVATYSATGTFTTPHLPPGTYTIEAASVQDVLGFTYVPSPQRTSVTVTAGRTASVSVSYAKLQATLTLTVSGLPPGALARFRVSGPTTYNLNLGNTSGFSLTVLPGTYTVTAGDYVSGVYTYRASPATRSAALSNGGSAVLSFGYSLVPGSLKIVASGLPSGASATVSVSGPNGYGNTVSATSTGTTLSNLTPGSYTATASRVIYGGDIYVPKASTLSATVSSGNTATVTFEYRLLPATRW